MVNKSFILNILRQRYHIVMQYRDSWSTSSRTKDELHVDAYIQLTNDWSSVSALCAPSFVKRCLVLRVGSSIVRPMVDWLAGHDLKDGLFRVIANSQATPTI